MLCEITLFPNDLCNDAQEKYKDPEYVLEVWDFGLPRDVIMYATYILFIDRDRDYEVVLKNRYSSFIGKRSLSSDSAC